MPSPAPAGAVSRRILILNQAFYPDVVSTAQHATDLAVSLAQCGHQVTAVASARGYDDPQQRYPRRETYRGVRILRVASTGLGKSARWRRAADFASFMLNCAARSATLPRADLVIALTSPPLISWLACLLLPWKARRLLFWAMDLNPDEAIAAGWLRPGSLPARVLQRLQMQSMRRAERIVALDRFMKDRLLAKGLGEEKIVVIPPWSHDAVRFDPEGRDAFRLRHGLQDKFVVMYSGNHSPCHPLDTILHAAERLAAERRIVFCFAGGGSEHRRIQVVARERRLGNVLCLPYQPWSELSASLSAADLHLAVMGENFAGIVHPCKVYNILQLGTPMLYLGPKQSHIADVAAAMNGSGQVYTARHGDVAQVTDIIRSLALNPQPWSRAHGSAAQSFSPQVLIPRMVEVINQAMEPAVRP